MFIFILFDLIKIFNDNNIKLINIPEDEYFNSKTLAVNILALSPRELVLIKGYPKTVELLLKVRMCKIKFI